jgi:hypothetical protein
LRRNGKILENIKKQIRFNQRKTRVDRTREEVWKEERE